MSDGDDRVSLANPAFRRLFELPDDLAGRDVGELGGVGAVIAEARCLKRGKRLVYGDVLMYVDGEPDRPTTHASVTYALPQSD